MVDINFALLSDVDPLASPWVGVAGRSSLRVASGVCRNSANADEDAAMVRSDSSELRSIVQYGAVAGRDGGPCLLDTSCNGYFWTNFDGANGYLIIFTVGSAGILDSDTVVTIANDDVVELMIDGNDIVVLRNTVEITRVADTTHRTNLKPGIYPYNAAMTIKTFSDGISAGQDINVGLASETDSAFSVGKLKIRVVGLTTETDTVLSIAPMHMVDVGLAEETDSAFSVGKRKTKTVGLNSEADSAYAVTPTGDLPTSYFTSFPDTENPISQGGMFKVGSFTGFYKNPRSTPGKCFAADFVGEGFDDCLAHLQNHAVSVDHRITMTISRAVGYTAGDTHEIGGYIRQKIGVGVTEEFVSGYEFLFEASGSFNVVRWEGTTQDSGNFTVVTPVNGTGPGTLADGDVIAIQVVGSDFEVFKNGISVATCSDATFDDGNPGMGFFVRNNGTTPENFAISSWSAESAHSEFQVGLAQETDSAFAVGVKKTHSVGLNTESDTAFSVGRRKNISAGLSTETDSALTTRAIRIFSLGLASETSTAFGVSRRKNRSVGLSFEGDTAFGVVGGEQGMPGGGYYGTRLGLGLG